MNPSALFTYARVSISRSASAHEGRGRRNERRVSRARNILRFHALASFSSSAFLFVSLPFISRYILTSLSLFFIPPLTNLHILPFSRNVMHNPPFPFSSLSHLHPLVPFVGKSIPSIPSPRCPLHFKSPAFLRFSQLCYLPPPSSLRFLAGWSWESRRNPCRER